MGMVSEPQTLVMGVKLLCGLMTHRKQSLGAAGAEATAAGSGYGSTSNSAWAGSVEEDAMDLDFESEPAAMEANGSGAAASTQIAARMPHLATTLVLSLLSVSASVHQARILRLRANY